MTYYICGVPFGDDHLAHYGVLGMKWGIRRYENPDGTLTEEGKKRFGAQGKYTYTSSATKRIQRRADRLASKSERAAQQGKTRKAALLSAKADVKRTRAERSQELDSRMEKYARSVTVGGNIVSRLLSGNSIGSKSYVMTLASRGGENRGDAGKIIRSGMAAIGGNYFLGSIPYQMIVRGKYVRKDQNG